MEVDPGSFEPLVPQETVYSADEVLQPEQNGLSTLLDVNDDSEESEDGAEHIVSAYQVTKWKRFRKSYNDEYVELFNKSCEHALVTDEFQTLSTSQVGAVHWTADEKDKLFTAVARYGRNDLERLSKDVTTKSPIEIIAYLNVVLDAYIDRQLFMGNTKDASLAEFPAAVETGPECEAALEVAADALLAYQEQFDFAAGQSQIGAAWLIDREAAIRLDAKFDEAESDSSIEPEPDVDQNSGHKQRMEKSGPRSVELFKLSTMLDLSEEFFMNGPHGDRQTHWQVVAESGQSPALTHACTEDFYRLVVDRLREVIGLAIHIADARLVSMQSASYSPSYKLSHIDVLAALDILELPHDSWDFWTTLARRNKFHIVTGSHNKGESRANSISYDKAEAILAPRRGRGRRRSMSIGSETSSATSQDALAGEASFETDADDAYTAAADANEEEATGASIDEDSNYRPENFEPQETRSSPDSESDEDFKSESTNDGYDRQTSLEDATDQYAETIDQMARKEDETILWQILGKRSRTEAMDEEKGQIRPKTLRKDPGELRGWSRIYRAEWEYYGRTENPAKQARDESAPESQSCEIVT